MAFPLASFERRCRTEQKARFDRAMPAVLARLKAEAPVDTGELRDSGRLGDTARTPTSWSREIVFPVDQAVFTDAGTAPHQISVRTARVLSNGTDIFGTTVNHPGTTGTKWFTGNAESYYRQELEAAG